MTKKALGLAAANMREQMLEENISFELENLDDHNDNGHDDDFFITKNNDRNDEKWKTFQNNQKRQQFYDIVDNLTIPVLENRFMTTKNSLPNVNAQNLQKQMSRKKSMKRKVSGKRGMSKFEPYKDEQMRKGSVKVRVNQEPEDILRFPSIKMNRFKSQHK